MPYETRLQRFTYDENRTYEILTRTMSSTDIQLELDEKLVGMPMGDTFNWEIGGVGNHLFVKPKFPRLVNPATLVTNKRTYQLIFKSSPDDGLWYQRITWDMPGSAKSMSIVTPESVYGKVDRKSSAQVVPETSIETTNVSSTVRGPIDFVKGMDFDYEIEGDASFKPTQVFNDKTRTWILFPDDIQVYPALFVKQGDELAVVSFFKPEDSKYFIAKRLFDEAVLKYNDEVITIRRKAKAKKWWFE
jgi:type IV secretion system protein VirB9